MMTRFNLHNDPCDDHLINCAVCLSWFALIVSCCDSWFDRQQIQIEMLETLSDCVWTSVLSCFLTQQQIQIKKIKTQTGSAYTGIDRRISDTLPPQQQEMIRKM